MNEWDYKIIFLGHLDYVDAATAINAEAKAGWEPWAVTPSSCGDRVYMRRRINNK